jgi:predicted nucleic acid binding AN1-type Zn finger protein
MGLAVFEADDGIHRLPISSCKLCARTWKEKKRVKVKVGMSIWKADDTVPNMATPSRSKQSTEVRIEGSESGLYPCC